MTTHLSYVWLFMKISYSIWDSLAQSHYPCEGLLDAQTGCLFFQCRTSVLVFRLDFSPSLPSAAYMRHWIRSALVKILDCCLFGAKPLYRPMLVYCQLDPEEQTSYVWRLPFCPNGNQLTSSWWQWPWLIMALRMLIVLPMYTLLLFCNTSWYSISA